MKDDRSRAFAVLVAVFLIGAIIGVGGSYLWLRPSADTARSVEGRMPPGPNSSSPPTTPEFNLTSQQEEELGVIWQETGDRLRALMRQERERMNEVDQKRKAIWDDNDRKVRDILDDKQKAQFDVWIEEVRNWRDHPPRRKSMEAPKEKRKPPETQPKRM